MIGAGVLLLVVLGLGAGVLAVAVIAEIVLRRRKPRRPGYYFIDGPNGEKIAVQGDERDEGR